MNRYLLLFLFIFLIPSVIAPRVDIPIGISAGNYSGVYVNDSYFHRGLSPQQVANLFTETDPKWSANSSSVLFNNTAGGYNISINSQLPITTTGNVTAGKFITSYSKEGEYGGTNIWDAEITKDEGGIIGTGEAGYFSAYDSDMGTTYTAKLGYLEGGGTGEAGYFANDMFGYWAKLGGGYGVEASSGYIWGDLYMDTGTAGTSFNVATLTTGAITGSLSGSNWLNTNSLKYGTAGLMNEFIFLGSVGNIEFVNDKYSPSLALINNNSLGSDLIINGNFATDSNWDKGTGWAISTGMARKNVAGTGTLSPTVPVTLVVGKWYELDFNYVRSAGGYILVSCGGMTSGGTSTTKIIFRAINTDNLVFTPSNTEFRGTIDNVVLKEFNGGNLYVGGDIQTSNDIYVSNGSENTIQLFRNGTIVAYDYVDLTPADSKSSDEAINVIKNIKSVNGEIEHTSLSDFVRTQIPITETQCKYKTEGKGENMTFIPYDCVEEVTGYKDGRSIGNQLTELINANQGMIEQIETLQSQINCMKSAKDFIAMKLC